MTHCLNKRYTSCFIVLILGQVNGIKGEGSGGADGGEGVLFLRAPSVKTDFRGPKSL